MIVGEIVHLIDEELFIALVVVRGSASVVSHTRRTLCVCVCMCVVFFV